VVVLNASKNQEEKRGMKKRTKGEKRRLYHRERSGAFWATKKKKRYIYIADKEDAIRGANRQAVGKPSKDQGGRKK